MEETMWSVLGIEATTEVRDIKRAYASRLKIRSPEADPAGYMKLREAYEEAKEYARRQQQLPQVKEFTGQEPNGSSGPGPTLPAPGRVAPAAPVATPQQIAISELHASLVNGDLARFLQHLDEVRAAGTFASLDDQYHFVGTVAILIQEANIEDSGWCARVAQALGAREHENIFTDHPRYWYAYNSLLNHYSAMRAAETQAHLDEQHDDVSAPGYLHVYHVLTSPFDAERLSALTRSLNYHRLAERLLERAKSDASIVIPFENREWWERTAMAGQHRPIADAIPAPSPGRSPEKTLGRFPFWAVGGFLFLLVNLLRLCSDVTSHTSSNLIDREKLRRESPMFAEQQVPIIVEQELVNTEEYAGLSKRLALCDPQTRSEILLRLYLPPKGRRSSGSVRESPSMRRAETDPEVLSMLEKCQGAGSLGEPGLFEPKRNSQ